MAARDNPYYIEPVNGMQALMSGIEGFDKSQAAQKEQQMQAGRQQAMAALQGGGDLRGPLAQLIGIGDTKGAEAIGTFAHHQATEAQAKAAQEQSAGQFKVTSGLHQQQFDLAKRQAEIAGKEWDLREVEAPDGGKQFVRTNKATGQSELVPIGGAPAGPTNPYAPTQKLTNDESNARSYVNRMLESHKTISGLEDINSGVGGFVGGVAAGRPAVRDSAGFNLVASADRQKSVQAQRNFVNALLRKESGAAISQQEFENAQKQYFPQPGDGAEVIAQKRTNRMTAMEGMMQGAGRGYKPPPDYVGTKGPATAGAAPAKSDKPVGYLDYFR